MLTLAELKKIDASFEAAHQAALETRRLAIEAAHDACEATHRALNVEYMLATDPANSDNN